MENIAEELGGERVGGCGFFGIDWLIKKDREVDWERWIFRIGRRKGSFCRDADNMYMDIEVGSFVCVRTYAD